VAPKNNPKINPNPTPNSQTLQQFHFVRAAPHQRKLTFGSGLNPKPSHPKAYPGLPSTMLWLRPSWVYLSRVALTIARSIAIEHGSLGRSADCPPPATPLAEQVYFGIKTGAKCPTTWMVTNHNDETFQV
jgi:hypothetical protein